MPSDNFCKDSLGALREMVKAHMFTVTKQAFRY